MKKRLTALFMTAALSLTTFAAAIPTSAAVNNEPSPDLIEVGTDLIAEYKPTSSAKKIDVEDGNGYLHIYDRYFKLNVPDARGNDRVWHRLQAALGYQPEKGFTFKSDVLYFVSVKARVSNHWATKAEADKMFPSYASRTQNVTANMYWSLSTLFDQKNISASQYLSSPWKRNVTLTDFIDPSLLSDANKTALAKHNQGFIVDSEINNAKVDWYENRNNDGSKVILNNDWREFTWAFMPASNVTVNAGMGGAVLFGSEGGEYRCVPVDIDDFKIWYYDANGNAVNVVNSSAQTLMGYDFNDVDNPPQNYDADFTRIGQLFKANVGWTQDQTSGGTKQEGHNVLYTAANVREYDYFEAKVAQSGSDPSAEIKYTFSEGVTLSPGVYEFTADVKLNFYDGYLDKTEKDSGNNLITKHFPQFIPGEDNKAKVTIKDNNDNGAEFDITPEWTAVSFKVTIPKESNVILSDITASFTDDTYSANKAYNIRNAKFVMTSSLVYDSEFAESEADVSYTIEDDLFAVTKGASDAKVEMVYPDSYVEGNKYLTVSGRTNERDGFILDLRNVVSNSRENDYRLSFKVRASQELSNLQINGYDKFGYDPSWTMVKLSAGLYRGKYVTAAPSMFVPNDQSVNYYRHRIGSSGAYWWYFSNAEWHTVDVAFNDLHQVEEGVDTRYEVIHFGGSDCAYNAVNFDIDDITVYSVSRGELWKQNFQGAKAGELSEALKEIFVPFKETWLADVFRTEEVALSIGEDAQYFTASNVKELTYTVPENSIYLTPGRYTVHADFKYPYFDGDRITVDVGSARQRNYIKENNNKFDVTAVVETENGKLKLKPQTVGNSWNECGFAFDIEEATDVKSIAFIFKDASGVEYTDVCYRNIYIDGYYPAGPGFPNNGIVLMLLLRKQAALLVEEEKAEAEGDRLLSDKEVVYSIPDGALTAITGSGSTKTKNEYAASFESGNKYLHVSGRSNSRDGFILDLRRAVLDVTDANYRLSFKIRAAATLTNIWTNNPTTGPFASKDSIRLGEGLYNGAYTPASPNIFSNATITTSKGFVGSINGWYFDNTGWTTVDVALSELKNNNVIHIGGGSSTCNVSNFDIDDVTVYIPGEEEPIYFENFEEAASGELSTTLSYFYVPFQNGTVAASYRFCDVALAIQEDREYLTSNGVSELKYTVAEDEITLAAGEYTLNASFFYPFFDGKEIVAAVTEDSRKQGYVASTRNAYDVTAVIETDNGTLTFDKYAVRNSWVDCEFSFKVENDTKVKTVSFKLTPAGEAKTTAVSFRDVYIDGNLAK